VGFLAGTFHCPDGLCDFGARCSDVTGPSASLKLAGLGATTPHYVRQFRDQMRPIDMFRSLLAMLVPCAAFAQPPAFEVASVKPAATNVYGRQGIDFRLLPGGRWSGENATRIFADYARQGAIKAILAGWCSFLISRQNGCSPGYSSRRFQIDSAKPPSFGARIGAGSPS
jgi:hypothetical protein